VIFYLFYYILISVFCWLICGINKHLFHYDWNPDPFVILKYLNVVVSLLQNWSSLACMQNLLLDLIMTHMNPVHTFITHISMISCNHYAGTYWILISNLKSSNDHCWECNDTGALHRNLSMSRSQNVHYLPSTEFFMLFLTPFLCYIVTIWWTHKKNYKLCNSPTVPLPHLY